MRSAASLWALSPALFIHDDITEAAASRNANGVPGISGTPFGAGAGQPLLSKGPMPCSGLPPCRNQKVRIAAATASRTTTPEP